MGCCCLLVPTLAVSSVLLPIAAYLTSMYIELDKCRFNFDVYRSCEVQSLSVNTVSNILDPPLQYLSCLTNLVQHHLHPVLLSSDAQPPIPFEMAESYDMKDPNFGTKEEDWTDLDADPDTGEFTEAGRRSKAAMNAAMTHRFRQRKLQRKLQSAHHDGIPLALYIKARDHQAQLTLKERHLLLSRGDIVGKALAYPYFLTAYEMHQVALIPPPNVVRANIQRATGGKLSTPRELYAKARDAMDRGEIKTTLSHDEILLITRSFYDTDEMAFGGARFEALSAAVSGDAPGTGPALHLIWLRLGLDTAVLEAASLHHYQSPSLPPPVSLPWPPMVMERHPIHLFQWDTQSSFRESHSRWPALPEDQKEAYRARSETLRQEAWAEHETAMAEGTSPYSDPRNDMAHRQSLLWKITNLECRAQKVPLPTSRVKPPHITGLKVFGEELGAEMEFQEVLRRWEDLTKGQREAYDAGATATNTAAFAAYRKERISASQKYREEIKKEREKEKEKDKALQTL